MNAPDIEEPLFDMQLIIDEVIRDQSPLLRHLHAVGKFDIHAPENGLYLPVQQELASKLGCSRYVRDLPEVYVEGMLGKLAEIEASADGQAALRGDPDATLRALQAVVLLRDTVTIGIINGDLMLA